MFTTKRDSMGNKFHTNATASNWKDLALEIRRRFDSGEYWVFFCNGLADIASYALFEHGCGFGGQTDKALFNTELGVILVATIKKGEVVSKEIILKAFELPEDSEVDVFFTANPDTQKFAEWVLRKGGNVRIFPYPDEVPSAEKEPLFGEQQTCQNYRMN